MEFEVLLVVLVQSAASLKNRAGAVGGIRQSGPESAGQIRNKGRVSQRVFPIMHLAPCVINTPKPAGAAGVDITHCYTQISYTLR